MQEAFVYQLVLQQHAVERRGSQTYANGQIDYIQSRYVCIPGFQ